MAHPALFEPFQTHHYRAPFLCIGEPSTKRCRKYYLTPEGAEHESRPP